MKILKQLGQYALLNHNHWPHIEKQQILCLQSEPVFYLSFLTAVAFQENNKVLRQGTTSSKLCTMPKTF